MSILLYTLALMINITILCNSWGKSNQYYGKSAVLMCVCSCWCGDRLSWSQGSLDATPSHDVQHLQQYTIEEEIVDRNTMETLQDKRRQNRFD